MHTDQIRNDQMRDAASRTLTVKPGHHPTQGQKRPFVAKGHDAILKNIQDTDGVKIAVTLMNDGSTVEGRLVARDKFTVTVLTDEGRRRTFYKHAIEGFEPITKGN